MIVGSMNIKPAKVIYDTEKSLMDGIIERRFITITDEHRQIGKTTAVMDLARKYDFAVIVPTKGIANIMRSKYNYEHVYSLNTNFRGYTPVVSRRVLVDELTTKEVYNLPPELKVITGFVKA